MRTIVGRGLSEPPSGAWPAQFRERWRAHAAAVASRSADSPAQPMHVYLRRRAVASLLPLGLLVLGLAVLGLVHFQRERDLQVQRWAHHLAREVDADLVLRIEGLRTMAALTSAGRPSATPDDWHRSASAYDRSFGMPVMLVDAQRRILRHSRRPPDSPPVQLPPHAGRPAFAQALDSGEPQIGDPVMGPVLQRRVVQVILPLRAEVLMGLVSTDTLRALMLGWPAPEQWQVSLMDSLGREITSTRAADAASDPAPLAVPRAEAALAVAPFRIAVHVGSWAHYRPTIVAGGLLILMPSIILALLALGARRTSRGLSASVRQLLASDSPHLPADPPRIREIEAVKEHLHAMRAKEHSAASREHFLLMLNDALHRLADADELVSVACRMLAEQLQVDRVCHVEMDEAAGQLDVACHATRASAPPLAGRYALSGFSGPIELLRGSRCQVVDDLWHAELLPAPDRQFCLSLQIVSCVVSPVFRADQLMGALCVTDAHPRAWQADDVTLIAQVSQRLWSSIQEARAEEALSARTLALTAQTRQLRWLASELTLAEHKTRELLSKTLHDHLQQILFSTSLTLQRAIARASGDPILQQVREGLKESMEAARSLSLEIFPPVLRTEGLSSALQWLTDWAQNKYRLSMALTADPLADPQALDVRILLFECVRELIFNAVKHAQAQGLRIELTVDADRNICIVVQDDGVGFDVHKAFRAGHDALGLGLFSIRERLTLLGGQMTVDSAPGQGARFTLRVPHQSAPGAEPASDATPTHPMSGTRSAGQATPKGDLRILLADDHALVRDGLRQLIASHPGLDVVGEAVHGDDALAQCRALCPDVVIIDRSMPVFDGLAATRRIMAEHPGTVVLGISMDEGDVPLLFGQAGAQGFFSKKDGAEALLKRLLLERSLRASQ